MHPYALNEMQRNLIEISYWPERDTANNLYAALQEAFIQLANLLQGYLIEKAVARFLS